MTELCEFLEEADRQGVPMDAIKALRAYDGEWDNIAVWRMAKSIDLRPCEITQDNRTYPARTWQTDPGWIVHWPQDHSHFHRIARLPPMGFVHPVRELEHITSFQLTTGHGVTNDNQFVPYGNASGELGFKPTDDGLWE
jgi:hypothetical protein